MLDVSFTGRTMPFFLMQAVAITLEDLLIDAFGNTKPTIVTKNIGYVWVAVWFYFSLPYTYWVFKEVGGNTGFVSWSPTTVLLSTLGVDFGPSFIPQ